MPIGTWELVVIFLAVLLLFGGKKIPEIARGLGKGIREFKRAANDIQRELDLHRLDDNITKRPKPDIPDKSTDTSKETPSTPDDAAASDAAQTKVHEPGPEVETEELAKQAAESRSPSPEDGKQPVGGESDSINEE
jgi:sec-independent protein translocase protein TatA